MIEELGVLTISRVDPAYGNQRTTETLYVKRTKKVNDTYLIFYIFDGYEVRALPGPVTK